MEPFLISCPSCKIRLQITNPEFIGREFACPRCKCRLEVKEPTPEERAAAATQSEGQAGETGHVTGTFRLGPPKNQSQDATTAVGEFADIESILATDSSSGSKPAGKWINQPVVETTAPSTAAAEAAQAHRANQQRWTWLVFSIVGGALVALMATSLVIYVLSTNGEQQREIAKKPNPQPAPENPPEKSTVKEPVKEPEKPVEKPTDKTTTPPDDPQFTLPSDLNKEKSKTGEEPSVKPDPAAPNTTAPAPSEGQKDPPAVPPGFESTKPKESEAAEKSSEKSEAIKKSVLSGLDGNSLITPEGRGALRKASGGQLDPPEADPTLLKPKPNLINVAEHLSETIPEVRAQKYALVDFLDLLSQLAGVPISLDPAILVRGGVDPRAEVSVVAENQSLRQIGETALRPLNLALVELGGGLVVTFPTGSQIPPLDLTGIPSAPAQVDALEKFIRQSVDPLRWGEPPAGAKLTIVNGQVQFQGAPRVAWGVKQLLDGVRAAETGQASPPVAPAAHELLKKPINFLDGRTLHLDELTAKLEKIAQCEIRIDWVSLGAMGWTPETTLSLLAQEEPLERVLQRICEPRAWSYRLLSSDILEITTFYETYAGAESRVISIKKQLQAGQTPEKIQAELAKAIAPAIPRSADPMLFVQVLKDPAVAAIRGPASVQALVDAWLSNAPTSTPNEAKSNEAKPPEAKPAG